MLRIPIIVICISVSVCLVGCSAGMIPAITTFPISQKPILAVVNTELALTPTVAAKVTKSEPSISRCADEVL